MTKGTQSVFCGSLVLIWDWDITAAKKDFKMRLEGTAGRISCLRTFLKHRLMKKSNSISLYELFMIKNRNAYKPECLH